jgi:ABC-type nickel/cobalt efflux system permease component RcnA
MSLEMTIVMLIAAWLAVAAAMLWGVMRISRRHHHHHRSVEPAPAKPHKHGKRHPHAPAH